MTVERTRVPRPNSFGRAGPPSVAPTEGHRLRPSRSCSPASPKDQRHLAVAPTRENGGHPREHPYGASRTPSRLSVPHLRAVTSQADSHIRPRSAQRPTARAQVVKERGGDEPRRPRPGLEPVRTGDHPFPEPPRTTRPCQGQRPTRPAAGGSGQDPQRPSVGGPTRSPLHSSVSDQQATACGHQKPPIPSSIGNRESEIGNHSPLPI